MLFSKKTKVIIDTNFLLLPGDGIDIFTEFQRLLDIPYQLCVVERTYHELEKIINGLTKAKGKDKFHAKLGYVMAKQQNIKVLNKGKTALSVDDQLVALAKDSYIATFDKALQKRISEAGGQVITKGQGKLRILS